MSYEITWEEKGVCRLFNDALTNDDILKSNQDLNLDSRFAKVKFQVINLLEVSDLSMDINTFHQLGQMDEKYYQENPNLKVAVIATQDTWSALTNMYKDGVEQVGHDLSWETQLHDNEMDARAWVEN